MLWVIEWFKVGPGSRRLSIKRCPLRGDVVASLER